MNTPQPPNDRGISKAIAAHQIGQHDWRWRYAVSELLRWSQVFDFEFKLELPPLVFRIAKLSKRTHGTFRPDHNEMGFRCEISVADHHILANRTEALWPNVLSTVLHESLHAWQFVHGKPGQGHYHNREFREKAESVGLLIDKAGASLGFVPDGPFESLLASQGLSVPEIPLAIEPPVKTKLRLWTCKCADPVRLRIARSDIRILCEDCGQRFSCSDPGVRR